MHDFKNNFHEFDCISKAASSRQTGKVVVPAQNEMQNWVIFVSQSVT